MGVDGALIVGGTFCASVLAWLLTYALHSTVLLSAVWVATRWGRGGHALKEVPWKAALWTPLLTAALHVGTGFTPFAVSLPLDPAPVGDSAPAARAATPPPRAPVRERTALHPVPDPGAAEPDGEVAAFLPPPPSASTAASSPAPAASGGPPPAHAATPREAAGSPPLDWTALALGLWCLAAAGCAGRWLLRRVALHRRLGPRVPVRDARLLALATRLSRTMGGPRSVRLSWSPLLPTAVALGRDEICLPERALDGIPPAQQEGMLAHEMAHLVRRDPAWLSACGLLESVFFFQPLNRVARRELQRCAEFLCDDLAAATTGEGPELASCLAEVAAWVRGSEPLGAVPGMALGRSELVARVERLLDDDRAEPRSVPRWLRLTAPAALVAATLALVPGVIARAPEGGPVAGLPAAPERPGAVRLELVGDRTWSIVHVPGHRPRLSLDGRELAGARTRRQGPNVIALLEDGRPGLEIAVLEGGVLSWTVASASALGAAAPSRIHVVDASAHALLELAPDGRLVATSMDGAPATRCEVAPTLVRWRAEDGRTRMVLHLAGDAPAAPAAGDPGRALGLVVARVSEALAAQLGVRAASVVMVERVRPDSPAATAGLERFDVVTRIDGRPLKDAEGFWERIGAKQPGEQVFLTVIRRGRTVDVRLVMAADRRPADPVHASAAAMERCAQWQQVLATQRGLLEELGDDDDSRRHLERLIRETNGRLHASFEAAVEAACDAARARVDELDARAAREAKERLDRLARDLRAGLDEEIAGVLPGPEGQALVSRALRTGLDVLEGRLAAERARTLRRLARDVQRGCRSVLDGDRVDVQRLRRALADAAKRVTRGAQGIARTLDQRASSAERGARSRIRSAARALARARDSARSWLADELKDRLEEHVRQSVPGSEGRRTDRAVAKAAGAVAGGLVITLDGGRLSTGPGPDGTAPLAEAAAAHLRPLAEGLDAGAAGRLAPGALTGALSGLRLVLPDRRGEDFEEALGNLVEGLERLAR